MTNLKKGLKKMNKKPARVEFIPKSAMKTIPLSKKNEILWDRFKSKYGRHRTWVVVKTGENKKVQTWFNIRELMRITEESYDNEKEKTEAENAKTST